jgi:hypothetical protein
MARGKENKRKQQAAKNAAAKLKKCLGVKDCDDLMDRMDKQDAEDSSPRRGRSKGLPKEDLSDDEEDAKEEEVNEEEYQKAKEEEANEEEYVKAVEAIMNANIEDGTKHERAGSSRPLAFLFSALFVSAETASLWWFGTIRDTEDVDSDGLIGGIIGFLVGAFFLWVSAVKIPRCMAGWLVYVVKSLQREMEGITVEGFNLQSTRKISASEGDNSVFYHSTVRYHIDSSDEGSPMFTTEFQSHIMPAEPGYVLVHPESPSLARRIGAKRNDRCISMEFICGYIGLVFIAPVLTFAWYIAFINVCAFWRLFIPINGISLNLVYWFTRSCWALMLWKDAKPASYHIPMLLFGIDVGIDVGGDI